MILLRLLIAFTAVTLVLSGGMYVLTHNRRYLTFCWQVVRFVVFLLLVLGALALLERYALVPWGVLL